jgi:DNA mismatch repair ATPase MutS
MHELGSILRVTGKLERRAGVNVTPNSLVLLDELGRSTTTIDGFSIAFAVAERLASTPNLLTLFATHFGAIDALKDILPVVRTFHLLTQTNPLPETPRPRANDELIDKTQKILTLEPASREIGNARDRYVKDVQTIFKYKVVQGALADQLYGIDTARKAGFPIEVVESARKIASELPVLRLGSALAFSDVHCAQYRNSQGCARIRNAVLIAQQLSHMRNSTDSSIETIRRGLMALKTKLRASRDKSRVRPLSISTSEKAAADASPKTERHILSSVHGHL